MLMCINYFLEYMPARNTENQLELHLREIWSAYEKGEH